MYVCIHVLAEAQAFPQGSGWSPQLSERWRKVLLVHAVCLFGQGAARSIWQHSRPLQARIEVHRGTRPLNFHAESSLISQYST